MNSQVNYPPRLVLVRHGETLIMTSGNLSVFFFVFFLKVQSPSKCVKYIVGKK